MHLAIIIIIITWLRDLVISCLAALIIEETFIIIIIIIIVIITWLRDLVISCLAALIIEETFFGRSRSSANTFITFKLGQNTSLKLTIAFTQDVLRLMYMYVEDVK